MAFANSIIGARTNHGAPYLDACGATNGRVPAAGLHLDDPGVATTLIALPSLSPELGNHHQIYPGLGYLLSSLIDDVDIIGRLDAAPRNDQLKAVAATAASSGSVALFHIATITPEAPAVAAALDAREQRKPIGLTGCGQRAARTMCTTFARGLVDEVAFGSPQCGLAEARALAALMAGRKTAETVDVILTTSRGVRVLLARNAGLNTLKSFGARFAADTCIVVAPLFNPIRESS